MAEVLTPLIPVLTSNYSMESVGYAGDVQISGTRHSEYGKSSDSWKLFNDEVKTDWQQGKLLGKYTLTNFITYFCFEKPVAVKKATAYGFAQYNSGVSVGFETVVFSDDGTNWTDAGRMNPWGPLRDKGRHDLTLELDVLTEKHKYWGIRTQSDSSDEWISIAGFQIYGITEGPEPSKNGADVSCYVNSSSENTINKNITKIKDIKCQIFQPLDILHPTLILRNDNNLLDCNYIYIPKFHRFYFARFITQKGGQMVAECNVDVLESWKDELSSLITPIIRQENVYNLYLNDSKMPFSTKGEKQVVKIQGGETPFLTDSQDVGYHYLLNSL